VSDGTANVSAEGAGTTFVLIPGAGADPRVYGATIDALRALGHDGIAPLLPLGNRPPIVLVRNVPGLVS
jgi:hypothetical protein